MRASARERRFKRSNAGYRLKFKLLYQQLFGDTTISDGNVRVAGGVSLNF